MNKIKKLIIVGISLSLVSASALAAGFGVSGEQNTQNKTQTINQLLTNASAGSSSGASQASQPTTGGSVKGFDFDPNKVVAQADQKNAASADAQSGANAASADPDSDNNSARTQAFSGVVNNMMPLTPEQIKTLRYLLDQSQKAASDYPGTPPKPTSSSVMVNLSPGSTPPVVRLRAGFVTSIVFLDATGQPWPIKAYDLGDPSSFNIQWDQKGNTLLVQALSAYKPGNLAVMLKGQDTPVMVTLMPGQRAVDYRVDLRLPGMGPNALPQYSNLPGATDSKLLAFLDGVPPSSAKTLQVSGGPCQAWYMDGHMYLRTMLTVLSPSWLSTMSSPDGTHVYKLLKAPVVLASYRGKTVQLSIQGL